MEPTQLVISKRVGVRFGGITAGSVYLALISNLVSAAPAGSADMMAQIKSNYGKLPLSFAANRGQTDAQVKFLSRGPGYSLFLTPSEAVLSLKKPQAQPQASSHTNASPLAKSSPSPGAMEAVLRMQFIGATASPQVLGKEEVPGRVNYLIGNDPSHWLTGVPAYSKVAYESMYPGIDLVYYGNQGQLEYDFLVAPGADPHNIKLAFQGADKIEVNQEGELVLHAANGEIRMHKPFLYQEIDGVRKPIEGGYVLQGDKAVGFQVAAYDATHPLVIDPILVYSTFLSGIENDTGFGIAVDQRGQAYVMGFTFSSDFPTKNALQPDFGGPGNELGDAFITKLTTDGTALIYSTYLGGSQHDLGTGIAVDQFGQAYVTGLTESFDFPTKNALQPEHNVTGFDDAFVAQLTADGAALRYSTYLGGSGSDAARGIAVDQLGQAYVTGTTDSSDFPIKNALQPTFGGDGISGIGDAFVAQFTANGRALRYSTYLGGSDADSGAGIAVDQRGQAYVTGGTSSSNFPTKNAVQPGLSGEGDAFVARLTANGRALGYATYLGGSENDNGGGIAVDRRGQAYVTGGTSSSNFPTTNAVQPGLGGESDAFVTQFTADGAELRYATYLGGSEDDVGRGITVDQKGQAYVTGGTSSSNFPINNALQSMLTGRSDVFVAQFTVNGGALRYATYLGGSEDDVGLGIAVDQQGQAYVTGDTHSFDFPTVNAFQNTNVGNHFSAFVAKIGSRPCGHEKNCTDNSKYAAPGGGGK